MVFKKKKKIGDLNQQTKVGTDKTKKGRFLTALLHFHSINDYLITLNGLDNAPLEVVTLTKYAPGTKLPVSIMLV